MKVYVHPCQTKNIGDEFNRWFWHEIFEENIEQYSDDVLLVGIGTVLNEKLPHANVTHILGSGVGYSDSDVIDSKHWTIHFVRGKLSAKALGIDPLLAISDPGILISRLRVIECSQRYDISFMPHIGIDSPRYKAFIEDVMGWHYISPSDEEEVILNDIVASGKLVTSAMHGAIIADSYRVPWFPVNTSAEILPFKWHDWFSSLNINASLTHLPAYWGEIHSGFKSRLVNTVKETQLKYQLRKIQNSRHFILSNARELVSKQEQILAKLHEVKPLIFEKSLVDKSPVTSQPSDSTVKLSQ
ncbi:MULTISPECIES: polysaccharide pyruvyl transferase family protein [Vibrio]|uniref:Polysaccharide pyruvyl transferase domain-containing protein n=2 Tax=Vibrio TaxID=662 RepID=A0A7X4LPD8_9VIBR|nr:MULTISPECIES: polysaccharide pyruvyl transferase family protein [Vibrio]MBF9002141.1 hypothetical protein [Vibrio nitrifigilis]MZI95554.1 hypothetical protein [Vibrio eleionomae]